MTDATAQPLAPRGQNLPQALKSRLSDGGHRLLHRLSPLLLVRYRYLRARGRWFPRRQPVTFDEKLLWMMLYWHHPLKSECADKYAVRKWVAARIDSARLPELYGVYDSPADIDFSRLPDRFVLKATHGCGFNIFCRGIRGFDSEGVRRELARWMRTDQGPLFGETHYSSIRPRIICEELLEAEAGRSLDDYKFFCFHGEVHCTMACTERTPAGAKYDIYDVGWKRKLPYSRSSMRASREIPRPAAYEHMLDAAKRLSQPFPFVRVDLYSIKGRAVFGEMTFTPHGGIDLGLTEVAQRTMGDLFHLPPPLPSTRSPRRRLRIDRGRMPETADE